MGLLEEVKQSMPEPELRAAAGPDEREAAESRVSWTPLARGGGASFCTHALRRDRDGRLVFRPTLGFLLFGGLFLLLGLGLAIGIPTALVLGDQATSAGAFAVPLIGGGIFAGVGGALLAIGARPVVFDPARGLVWRGWRDPASDDGRSGARRMVCRLDQVRAIQLVEETIVSSKGKRYRSTELILVRKDGERLLIVDHGDLVRLRRDAADLAEFLHVPVWESAATQGNQA